MKCMIACLGSKIFNMLQVTGNWKMSEVLKLVLGSLSCGCKGEDHNGSKPFTFTLKMNAPLIICVSKSQK